jgi:energy-coupling factor transport system ATP-binding protein
MITLSELTFAYSGQAPVLDRISLEIAAGSHVAIMGPNGSGKSTLALLMKGLLSPTGGSVAVDGFQASIGENARDEVMQRVGIIFQNPENTIVSTTVEREIAFGLENLGVPGAEMQERVEEALRMFKLEEYRFASPDRLSGGEKQRLALAAVMVMQPEHLILDEPTSLLDPAGSARILGLISEAAARGITVIHITQFAAEALAAERAIVLANGGVARDGAPREALRDAEELGIEGLEDVRSFFSGWGETTIPDRTEHSPLSLEDVSFVYDRGTPFAHRALEHVDLKLPGGSSTVLLGPSGSGKTTLLEIVAGITPPTSGKAPVQNGMVRAMAFQFPEDQVFGDTVELYAAFGPENLGFSMEDTREAVTGALLAVGLDPETYRERDPFTLSGGEKRRVALAGVLAMRPDMLVLDEPTAGLDRRSTDRVVGFLREYVRQGGTLLFSTHDFRVARRLARHAIVLSNGSVETFGEIRAVFETSPWLRMLREQTGERLNE